MDLRHVTKSDYSPYDDLYGDIFLLLELRSLLDFCQSTSVQQERGLSCEENKASGTLVNNAHCAAKFNPESNQLIK